jgi:hypothetical protein
VGTRADLCVVERKKILSLPGIELRFPGLPESSLIGVPVRAAFKEVRVHSASCTMGSLSHASLVLRLINHRDNFNFTFNSNIKFRVNLLGVFWDEISRKMASHYVFMLCSSCPKEVRSASKRPMNLRVIGRNVTFIWICTQGKMPLRIADQDRNRKPHLLLLARGEDTATARATLMVESGECHTHRSR